MYIDINSLIINGIKMGNYLTNAKFGYHDTWGSDTGYTLDTNSFMGTFKGTFPKFTLYFKPLTTSEIIYLTNAIFRRKIQNVTYDDPDGTRKNVTTHKGDFELEYNYFEQSKGFTYELVGNEVL